MSTAVLKTNAPDPHAEEELRETVSEGEPKVMPSSTEEQPPTAESQKKHKTLKSVLLFVVLFLVAGCLLFPIKRESEEITEWRAPLYMVVQWNFRMNGYGKTGIYFFPHTMQKAEDVWDSCEAPVMGVTYAEASKKESELLIQKMNQSTAIYEAQLEQNKKDNRKAFEKRQAELEAKKAAQEASEKAAAESAAPEDTKTGAVESTEKSTSETTPPTAPKTPDTAAAAARPETSEPAEESKPAVVAKPGDIDYEKVEREIEEAKKSGNVTYHDGTETPSVPEMPDLRPQMEQALAAGGFERFDVPDGSVRYYRMIGGLKTNEYYDDFGDMVLHSQVTFTPEQVQAAEAFLKEHPVDPDFPVRDKNPHAGKSDTTISNEQEDVMLLLTKTGDFLPLKFYAYEYSVTAKMGTFSQQNILCFNLLTGEEMKYEDTFDL